MSRQAGRRNQRAAGAARLPHSCDHVFDTVTVRTAYRCRAYPDHPQQQVLNRTFGCVRVVWNQTLAARHARWQADRTSTSYAETDAALTLMKKDPDLAFLTEVSSVPLQQALRHQHQAFTAFFAGAPATRGSSPAAAARPRTIPAEPSPCAAGSCGWPRQPPAAVHLVLAGGGRGRAGPDDGGRVPGAGRPLVRDLYHRHDAPEPLEKTGRAVGVDLGVTDFAVTSDGEKIANPRHLARKARNLARYQRRLARCRKGSANRAKAKMKVARAHRKVRDARPDFLHRASTRLVRETDVIVIEDLNVSGMVRNRRLARAISDCGWGEFRRQLAYKCERAGRRLVVIDRWYPSSKTCSACGYLLAGLSLCTRQWTCPSCGARHDRDLNAAKNILAAGQAVAACGAGVRHSGPSRVRQAVKQEPRPVTAGIPVLQGEE